MQAERTSHRGCGVTARNKQLALAGKSQVRRSPRQQYSRRRRADTSALSIRLSVVATWSDKHSTYVFTLSMYSSLWLQS